MGKLSEKQKRFAELYVQLGNAEKAAEQAGYSARGNTTKLLQNTTIMAYVDELNSKIQKETIASAEEVKEFLTLTMRSDHIEPKDRIKAADLLNKTYGAYIDRKEISGDMALRIEVDYGQDG
ncbi:MULTISPECIES: terminase small subunit [Exiguobacterium]|uniref:terminase small subunit n=1 Tax=Exiguobacterium TaxID=33986 RepID=UPI001AE0EA99|nr:MULTISPECIES: terminase small subunit [Exiguobacterium]MCT4779836.1 terminase small subunit [Exiguobacterium soli]